MRQEDAVAMGTLHFSFEDKPDWERVVYVFIAERWTGEPQESDEMAPEWFGLNSIPYEHIMSLNR
jgi:8-oxo-dGTP diphosphatase